MVSTAVTKVLTKLSKTKNNVNRNIRATNSLTIYRTHHMTEIHTQAKLKWMTILYLIHIDLDAILENLKVSTILTILSSLYQIYQSRM